MKSDNGIAPQHSKVPILSRASSLSQCRAMTPSTKASIATSVTALLSITTPFVQPTDCETQWRTASASSRTFRGTTLMTLLMVSDPAASCYPSGWDDAAPDDRLRFMPGVCPDGWTYNQMGENGSRDATTAFCCDKFVDR